MSQNCVVSFPEGRYINAVIPLTGSKSESNRALILNALSDGKVKIENLSEAFDTVTLKQNLESIIRAAIARSTATKQQLTTINIGPAGTAMRFLTAFLSLQDGNFLLTGSERMKQRPVGILAEAMKTIGANISYAEKEGFPPLHIQGPLVQATAHVKIKGDISSQYISALLLVAPALPEGLTLEIDGELTSRPYVEMTLAMMEQTGISYEFEGNLLSVPPQPFRDTSIYVEPDWSAASYWYSVVALSDKATIFLPGLTKYSLQGDSRITELMANFGIRSVFRDGGVEITKDSEGTGRKIFDLKDCPDLAQTIIVCCAALGHDARFTGLETLKIKETDRVLALQQELEKIGVKLVEKGINYLLDCSSLHFPEQVSISTYEDHRMAMAFAPLALRIPKLTIEDCNVVEKSYPDFWKHLELAGFDLN